MVKMNINISSFIPAITFVLYIVFTVFGLYRKREDRILWPFILYMLAMTVWSFGSLMMHLNSGVLTPLFWNRFMVVGMLGGPITIFHSMFELVGLKRTYYYVQLYLGYAIYAYLLYLNFSGHIVANAWFDPTEFHYSLGNGAPIAYFLSYIYILLVILLLTFELSRTKSKIDRKKLRLPLFGASVMLLGVLGNLYEPIGRYPIDLLSSAVNAVLIFYAVYKYRLVHYSSYVLRAILYFVLVVVSAFVFYGINWVFYFVLRSPTSEISFVPSLILGIAAAIIFQPLRKGTTSVIERIYLGRRFGYNQNLRAFSESLTSLVDLTTLSQLTVEKTVETFDLEWAIMVVLDYTARSYKIASSKGISLSNEEATVFVLHRNAPFVQMLAKSNGIYLNQKKTDSLSIYLPDRTIELKPNLVVPLKFKGRLNGFIVLGNPREKEYFNQFDFETLEILSGQCAVTLENAISFERLKRQQKRLQEMNNELTISRNKLEAFFDGITTPIAIQDINYNIIMVNQAATRYFRTPYEKLLGAKCYKMFFGRNKPCENCMAQDSLHTGLQFGIERKHPTHEVNFSIQFYPIHVPPGSDRLFLEFFQDISQQKRLQEELIQSEKLASIGTLASGIAHEINNPLGGIIGTAEIMLDQLDPETKLHEYATDIVKYSRGAAEVIKDLTSFSRQTRGAHVGLDVVGVLESALKLAQRGMNFADVEVVKDYEELPVIESNPNELEQVFLNLIINAVQAMDGRGTLFLDCRRSEWNLIVAVRDTGPGIEAANLDKVFNPFFTTKDPGKGTGLGLSICHQIVYRMGGRVNVKSERGEGTEFTVNLPLTEEDRWKIRFANVRGQIGLEDVFFLQRKILVGEKGYLEETIRRPVDESAYHILAYKGLQPVGTVSCMLPNDSEPLPIERHFKLRKLMDGKRCAEIDRLAVMKEERGSIIPLGLMTLAYLYARQHNAERLFLDVFSDERKHITMYQKLGFQVVGEYESPSPVTVMLLDSVTDYERKAQQMDHFVKPFMSRLIRRLDFDEADRQTILAGMETVTSSAPLPR
ncbi:MAG TPA: GNAT family N-acetyltransferase [Spirochaetia bacterium]|nr:GNAT family N-acetyltransferase [Spirochaetia bacterium]